MPVLSRGVVAKSLGLLVAASYLLLNTNEKRLFFTPTGSREDTAVRKMPSSSPICKHLIVQSLCKNNNSDRNRLLDKPTIVLSCCLLLAAAKTCCSALAPKRWCTTSTG